MSLKLVTLTGEEADEGLDKTGELLS